MKDQNLYSPCCPRCYMTSVEMMGDTQTVVCSACGWTTSGSEIVQETKSDKKFATRIFVFSMVLFAFLAHTSIWGEYANAILPLKIKQLLSLASVDDLKAMEKICVIKKRQSCLEVVYISLVEMEPTNSHAAAELGHIRYKNKNFMGAQNSYVTHFERKGQDATAAYHLALMYDSQKKTNEAARYYEKALALEPNRIQADLIQNYVAMLARENRSKEALRVIETVRRRGPVLKMFMAREYAGLKKQI